MTADPFLSDTEAPSLGLYLERDAERHRLPGEARER